MHFSNEITLGNIVTVAALLGMGWKIISSVGKFFVTALRQVDGVLDAITEHTNMLKEHGLRMSGYESRLNSVVVDLQGVIGRMDVIQSRVDINHRMDYLQTGGQREQPKSDR